MRKVYTGKGDDGTTGLFYGGRVAKDDARPEAYGTVDEAQAAIGLARAALGPSTDPALADLGDVLVEIERDLYVLMAELATADENRDKLVPGQSLLTEDRVEVLSARTDELAGRFEFPTEFVVPGQNELSARLDVARTVARRAERRVVPVVTADSQVVPYLNRLSSLLWTAARLVEASAGGTLLSKQTDGGDHR